MQKLNVILCCRFISVYSATLLSHAKDLFTFADKNRGKYSDSILDAKKFYP